MGRTAQTNGFQDIHMKASSKNTTDPRYAIPHTPFEEFTLKKAEELIAKLERVKPKNAKVDVTPMEDSHHAPCMREMTAIMMHDIDEGDARPNIYALYEFCPTCEIAIRVL